MFVLKGFSLSNSRVRCRACAWMSGGSSTDRQALLQAMLQRLKLQADLHGGSLPASPAAPCQQTPGPSSRAAHNGSGMALVDSPGAGPEAGVTGGGHGGRSWDSREEFRNPAPDSDLDNSGTGAKVNGERGLLHGPLSDNRQETAGLHLAKDFSSTSCKDNPAASRVGGCGGGPTVPSSVGRGGLFPVHTQKEAEGTSSTRTNDKLEVGKKGKDISVIEESVIHDAMRGTVGDERNIISSLAGNTTAAASHYPRTSPNSDPGALLSATGSLTRDASPPTDPGSSPQSTGRGGAPAAHQEEAGPPAQSQDAEIGSNMASNPSAPLRRDRASGSRTKRWTQKIKEKFKEKGGSLKKRKGAAGKGDVKAEEEGKVSGFRGTWC